MLLLTFFSHPSPETFSQSAVTTLVSFVFVHNTLPVEPGTSRERTLILHLLAQYCLPARFSYKMLKDFRL